MVIARFLAIGFPFTSPLYSPLMPVALTETENAPPVGDDEMPQALIKVASWKGATPGSSETRFVCRKNPFSHLGITAFKASDVGSSRWDSQPTRPLIRKPAITIACLKRIITSRKRCLYVCYVCCLRTFSRRSDLLATMIGKFTLTSCLGLLLRRNERLSYEQVSSTGRIVIICHMPDDYRGYSPSR